MPYLALHVSSCERRCVLSPNTASDGLNKHVCFPFDYTCVVTGYAVNVHKHPVRTVQCTIQTGDKSTFKICKVVITVMKTSQLILLANFMR